MLWSTGSCLAKKKRKKKRSKKPLTRRHFKINFNGEIKNKNHNNNVKSWGVNKQKCAVICNFVYLLIMKIIYIKYSWPIFLFCFVAFNWNYFFYKCLCVMRLWWYTPFRRGWNALSPIFISMHTACQLANIWAWEILYICLIGSIYRCEKACGIDVIWKSKELF